MSDLILGTAQFGQVYGATNPADLLSESAVFEILQLAEAQGISYLDTAVGYGEASARLGRARARGIMAGARVVTKLRFPETGDLAAWALAEARRFCDELGVEKVAGCLLHHVPDFSRPAVWEALAAVQAAGLVAKTGLSAYEPADLVRCPSTARIELIQVPYNVLDDRWESVDWSVWGNPEVHVRSAFLQGLLLAGEATWPSALRGAAPAVHRFMDRATERAGVDALTVCLQFLRATEWVDGVVAGVYSAEQLGALALAWDAPRLRSAVVDEIRATRPPEALAVRDPRYWAKS